MHALTEAVGSAWRRLTMAAAQRFTEVYNRDKLIEFYDLRDPEAAKARGVTSGYYLVVSPVSQREIQIDNLLFGLEVRLVAGVQGGLKADFDDSVSWLFSAAGYIAEKQLLVVRAEPQARTQR